MSYTNSTYLRNSINTCHLHRCTLPRRTFIPDKEKSLCRDSATVTPQILECSGKSCLLALGKLVKASSKRGGKINRDWHDLNKETNYEIHNL